MVEDVEVFCSISFSKALGCVILALVAGTSGLVLSEVG